MRKRRKDRDGSDKKNVAGQQNEPQISLVGVHKIGFVLLRKIHGLRALFCCSTCFSGWQERSSGENSAG